MTDATTLPERTRGTTVERVVAQLKTGILAGRYAPGQRLIEADLTGDFSVSRGPVREALRRLSAEGLVELVPNRGALVRRLSFTETLELFEIRTELEALAARRAADAVTERAVRAAFEQAARPIWSADPRLSTLDYLDENARFHEAVIVAGGNVQLLALGHQLQLSLIMFPIMMQLSRDLAARIMCTSVTEHRDIAGAILEADPAMAEDAMRRHLCRAAEFVGEMPKGIFRPEECPAPRLVAGIERQ